MTLTIGNLKTGVAALALVAVGLAAAPTWAQRSGGNLTIAFPANQEPANLDGHIDPYQSTWLFNSFVSDPQTAASAIASRSMALWSSASSDLGRRHTSRPHLSTPGAGCRRPSALCTFYLMTTSHLLPWTLNRWQPTPLRTRHPPLFAPQELAR